jgi:hypothetical protein
VERNTSLLWNIHRVSDGRQIEIHTAEPSVPQPSDSEVQIPITNLKRYKSSGSDLISAELIQTGDKTLQSKIYKLITPVWNKELPVHWNSQLLHQFTRREKI